MIESDEGFGCFNCKFFEVDSRCNDFGDCRRHAPQMLGTVLRYKSDEEDVMQSGFRNAVWPEVITEHWCGEWQRQAIVERKASDGQAS